MRPAHGRPEASGRGPCQTSARSFEASTSRYLASAHRAKNCYRKRMSRANAHTGTSANGKLSSFVRWTRSYRLRGVTKRTALLPRTARMRTGMHSSGLRVQVSLLTYLSARWTIAIRAATRSWVRTRTSRPLSLACGTPERSTVTECLSGDRAAHRKTMSS